MRNQKINSLEILRGLACILVLISHFRVATKYFRNPSYDWIQLFTAWGKESVIIFFMLSGMVINLATQKTTGRLIYFKKRAIRIIPIYYVIIGISIFLCIIFSTSMNIENVLGNVFFLGTQQKYVVSTIPYNQAVWSISCEMFFYLVFGLLLSFNRRKAMIGWLMVSILAMFLLPMLKTNTSGWLLHILYMFSMSFIWIIGFFIYEFRHLFKVSMPTAILSLLLIPLAGRIHTGIAFDYKYHLLALYLIPFFSFLIQTKENPQQKFINFKYAYVVLLYIPALALFLNFTKSTNANILLYSIVPISSLLFYLPSIKKVFLGLYHYVAPFLIYVGSISYAIYLIHVPVMYFTSKVFPQNMVFGILFILATVAILSILLEKIMQPRIAKLF